MTVYNFDLVYLNVDPLPGENLCISYDTFVEANPDIKNVAKAFPISTNLTEEAHKSKQSKFYFLIHNDTTIITSFTVVVDRNIQGRLRGEVQDLKTIYVHRGFKKDNPLELALETLLKEAKTLSESFEIYTFIGRKDNKKYKFLSELGMHDIPSKPYDYTLVYKFSSIPVGKRVL